MYGETFICVLLERLLMIISWLFICDMGRLREVFLFGVAFMFFFFGANSECFLLDLFEYPVFSLPIPLIPKIAL